MTSPNRRFADLVMQRQVVAHASGRSGPFGREQLAAWGDRAEGRLAAYEEAERNIQEHWARVWLTQHPGAVTTGTVRRVGDGSARVWLDELALPAESVQRLDAGRRLTFRVVSVDVDRQRVQVEPVP
jgi:exoribonuclease R